MDEKLIFESLYWLVDNTKVEIGKLDTKQMILNKLGSEISRLTPKEEKSLQMRTQDALRGK